MKLPNCDECGMPQAELGALEFSPPDNDGKCLKRHVCVQCWNRRAAQEPEPSDRERAGFWATKDCPACGGRGETYPLCPSCADSTEDHECPDPVKCKVCDERGEIVDTQLRDQLAAEFARVRAEERERCVREIERRRVPNTDGSEDKGKDAMSRAMHAWASQELALLRDAIRGRG